jgi:hypothetical protein
LKVYRLVGNDRYVKLLKLLLEKTVRFGNSLTSRVLTAGIVFEVKLTRPFRGAISNLLSKSS